MNISTLEPKKLFLIDAFGAVLSAFLLGIILVRFEAVFGMPAKVLYVLALLPCLFAVFSFFNYFKFTSRWRKKLKIIASLNLAYCVLTIILMIYFSDHLTIMGFGYFVVEILIVAALSWFELKRAWS